MPTTETIPARDVIDVSQTASWKDYFHMTKPTITLLVVITAIPGFLLATNAGEFKPVLLLIALLGSGLASASAAIFNQLVEKDIDSTMERTYKRSLPTGKVSTIAATNLAIFLGVLGLGLLYFFATPLSAIVAAFGHVFYVVIYTMYLKRRTPQNIVIGGAAGAVGPMIGWSAVTGTLSWESVILFLIIFLWTPPHFWSLALKYKDDYARAKIPMYPVVYGDHKTRREIMLYTYTLIPPILALYFMGSGKEFFLVTGMALTLKFVWDATKLFKSGSNEKAMPLFYYSCIYTLAVFALLSVERLYYIF